MQGDSLGNLDSGFLTNLPTEFEVELDGYFVGDFHTDKYFDLGIDFLDNFNVGFLGDLATDF